MHESKSKKKKKLSVHILVPYPTYCENWNEDMIVHLHLRHYYCHLCHVMIIINFIASILTIVQSKVINHKHNTVLHELF